MQVWSQVCCRGKAGGECSNTENQLAVKPATPPVRWRGEVSPVEAVSRTLDQSQEAEHTFGPEGEKMSDVTLRELLFSLFYSLRNIQE